MLRIGCLPAPDPDASPVECQGVVTVSVALVTGSAGLIGSEAVRHFAGLGPGRRRHRQRHAPAVLRRGGVDRLERAAADQRPGRRRTRTTTSTSATGTRWPRSSAGTARDIAVVIHTAGAALATTGRCATRSPTSTSTPAARSTCCRTSASTASRRRSSTAPPTRCTATGPTACRWSSWTPGGRSSPATRTTHGITRGHVDRRLPALGLRRLQGGRGRHGAGVRPLLRHEDRLLPRRHADRPGALRRPSCTASSAT